MVRFLLLATVLSYTSLYAHEYCKLPQDEVLTVGCTTNCKYFYRKAIYRAANYYGYPVRIVNMYNEELNINFDEVDAVVNPGGADIDPKYYKGKVDDDLREQLDRLDYLVNYSYEGEVRDPFEYKFWRKYFSDEEAEDLPALGICRGMQMMAVSQDIPLYIDISEEIGIRDRRYVLDRVHVNENEDSRLKSILGYTHFLGYKQHHQGIRIDYFLKNQNRWPHLKISSYSNGGRIAESLEASSRLALGTQFHPEMDWWTERLRIFTWLLEKGCENKNKKLAQQRQKAAWAE